MKAKDKELINEAIEQMKAAVSGGYESPIHGGVTHRDANDVTYIAAILEDGTIYHFGNQACHAGLSDELSEVWNYEEDCPRDDLPPPLYIVHRIQWKNNIYRQFPEDMKKAFFEWLTVDSPYAEIFAIKGGEEAVDSGYLVAHCDVPSNLLAGGLFAARAITEDYGHIAWMWWKLVQRSVHPSVAFYYAHKVSCKDHENIYVNDLTWHTALNGNYLTKESLKAFVSGNMENKNRSYRKNNNYAGVHTAWGGDYSNEMNEDLIEMREKVMYSDEVNAVANPFLKKRIKETCDIDKFMDLYAPYIINRHAEYHSVVEEEHKVA